MSKVSERNQRLLKEIAKLPGNHTCADCNNSNPRTHISRIKSISFDTWTRDQVEDMKNGGNIAGNAKYNPDPTRNRPPIEIDPLERNGMMETFIREKYEKKSFMIKTRSTRSASAVEIQLGGGGLRNVTNSIETQASRLSKEGGGPIRATSLPFAAPSSSTIPTTATLPPSSTLPIPSSIDNRPRAVTVGAIPPPPIQQQHFNPSIWDDMSSLSIGSTQPSGSTAPISGISFQPLQQTQSYFSSDNQTPPPVFPSSVLPLQNSSLYPTPTIERRNPFSTIPVPTNPFFSNGYATTPTPPLVFQQGLQPLHSPSLNPYLQSIPNPNQQFIYNPQQQPQQQQQQQYFQTQQYGNPYLQQQQSYGR